jgi:hypothetical protein
LGKYIKENKMENGSMEKNGDLLLIDKQGIISLIKNNTDGESGKIDGNVISLVKRYYDCLSVKQQYWILEKVKYIIRHNDKYRDFRGIKDIQFI